MNQRQSHAQAHYSPDRIHICSCGRQRSFKEGNMEFSAKCLSPVCGHSNRRDRMTRVTPMRVTTSHSHAMRAALVLVVKAGQ